MSKKFHTVSARHFFSEILIQNEDVTNCGGLEIELPEDTPVIIFRQITLKHTNEERILLQTVNPLQFSPRVNQKGYSWAFKRDIK